MTRKRNSISGFDFFETDDRCLRCGEPIFWSERVGSWLHEGGDPGHEVVLSEDFVPILRDVKRGDIVSVGRTKWSVLRSLGTFQAYATKHPSKGKKLYMIQSEGRDDPNRVVVYQVGGSGQRIGSDVARGMLTLAVKPNRSGGRIRKMFVGGYIQDEDSPRWTRVAEVVFADNVDRALDQAISQTIGRNKLRDSENFWVHMVVDMTEGLPVVYADNEAYGAPVVEVRSDGDTASVVAMDLASGDVQVIRIMAQGRTAEELAEDIVEKSMGAITHDDVEGFYSAVVQFASGEIAVITG